LVALQSALTAIGNETLGFWVSGWCAYFVQLVNDFLTTKDFSEYYMFSVKPGAFHECYEKL
jgi:hypothetical protein